MYVLCQTSVKVLPQEQATYLEDTYHHRFRCHWFYGLQDMTSLIIFNTKLVR